MLLALVAAAMLGPGPARAAEALVAVASNFAEAAARLESDFERATGHELKIVTGATGQLFAQVTKGAPFDMMLAADQERPARLEAMGHAVAGSRFTYATGQLVLWSPDPDRIGADGAAAIAAGDYRHIAIANPDLAPYGRAARQALENLGLLAEVKDRIVMGQNAGQAFSMVATGNAELGLVARSHAVSPRNEQPGSLWAVPASLHDPIRQDAVLLARAADNPAARAFLDYLGSDAAQAVIETYGYMTE